MSKAHLAAICIFLFFGSCCNEDFIIPEETPPPPDFDTRAGAIDVTVLINTCSTDAKYTTIGATPDSPASSCAPSGPKHNRWFKFKAPPTNQGSIYVFVGGVKGTQIRTVLTLYDTDGTTELACSKYGADTDTVSFYDSGWTAGAYYYFTVDVFDDGSEGTFTLCLSDTD